VVVLVEKSRRKASKRHQIHKTQKYAISSEEIQRRTIISKLKEEKISHDELNHTKPRLHI
jgi:hypothetical protein